MKFPSCNPRILNEWRTSAPADARPGQFSYQVTDADLITIGIDTDANGTSAILDATSRNTGAIPSAAIPSPNAGSAIHTMPE